MPADKINSLIARAQRGFKLKKGDAFLRGDRVAIIKDINGSDVSVEYAGGKSDTVERKHFLSRKIYRITVKKGEPPTTVSIASNAARTKNIPKRAKLSLLRGLAKNSTGDDKREIEDLIAKTIGI